MKKNFIVIVFALLCSVTEAQLIRGYGLKVGGTLASQTFDYATDINIDPDSKFGFNVGVFAEFLDVPFVSVVGEINYVKKTTEEEIAVTTVDNPDGNSEKRSLELGGDYLNISLLGKLRTNLVVVSPYLVAGPKFDIELSKINEYNLDDNFNKGLVGLKVGAGTEINLIAVNLLAEFIYDLNFTPFYDGEALEIKTNSFDFRIGIYF